MIDSINKPKLPKGLAYVLNTSQLETALNEADIDCHINLDYWTPQSGNSVLDAFYLTPNQFIPHFRVSVRAGVVPAEKRSEASLLFVEQILPQCIQWLDTLLKLPENSPILHQKPYFYAEIEKGIIGISNLPTF